LNLILLGAFLAFSFLGAGSGKPPRGPPPRLSNTGETMTERPPVLGTARYARAPKTGQR
jgi:hypothetical protein